MTDEKIIELYWSRDESALEESSRQYGRYCFSIAHNILKNKEDSDECVNDTWLKAWNAIPPQRPNKLSLFIGRITRNLAFDRFKAQKAQKRCGGEFMLVLEELDECIPSKNGVESAILDEDLNNIINSFLHMLPKRECSIFLARYWYSKPLAEIAQQFSVRENSVKASLFRSRKKLKAYLEKEGVYL
ncbi:sigma-70 family RNA polymerase sigma factor [Lachnospiraceae bacterium 54-53]